MQWLDFLGEIRHNITAFKTLCCIFAVTRQGQLLILINENKHILVSNQNIDALSLSVCCKEHSQRTFLILLHYTLFTVHSENIINLYSIENACIE